MNDLVREAVGWNGGLGGRLAHYSFLISKNDHLYGTEPRVWRFRQRGDRCSEAEARGGAQIISL